MAATDYATIVQYVTTTVDRVEKKTPTEYLVPKSALIETVGGKLDTDFTALNALMLALGQKMDTDFTAQNGAVAGSSLDTDYTAAATTTLDVNYGTTVADS